MSSDGTNRLPSKDIDLVLSSTTSAWGPLACIGHEGGVDPGDWWGAFWWAMEQRWQSLLAEQTEAEKPVLQTRLLSSPAREPTRRRRIGMSEDDTERSEVAEEILDATCGGRTIWLPGQKQRDDTLYIDRRELEAGFHGQEGRTYAVQPDEVQDFRDLPYPDASVNLVVFDPPHAKKADGMNQLKGVMTKKYGALHAETWQADLRAGFEELWRVLAPGGTLVFKFADNAVDFTDVLELAPVDPLFGTTSKKTNVETRWFVFYKPEDDP